MRVLDRLDGRTLTLAEFSVYMDRNEPVIIANSVDEWRAVQEWVQMDGTPNWDCLLTHFGDIVVPISKNGGCALEKMSFKDFIKECTSNPDCGLYLKDWHFATTSNIDWYALPNFLKHDWINNEPDVMKADVFRGDYRFCYMGSAGFHADVMNSYSWSANICGRKRWLMLPPGAELKLSKPPDSIVDLREEPDFEKAGGFEFWQGQGEIVFVPSCYYHQVHNEVFTISINHNWINSFNWKHVVRLLLERLECCKREVKLIREYVEDHADLVEKFLRDDFGLNLAQALQLSQILLSPHSTRPSETADLRRREDHVIRSMEERLKAESKQLGDLGWLRE